MNPDPTWQALRGLVEHLLDGTATTTEWGAVATNHYPDPALERHRARIVRIMLRSNSVSNPTMLERVHLMVLLRGLVGDWSPVPRGGSALTAYWMTIQQKEGWDFGVGVSARSNRDAILITIVHGWLDLSVCRDVLVSSGVTLPDMDQNHMLPNCGPLLVRGLWYPCGEIGISNWADDRIGELVSTEL